MARPRRAERDPYDAESVRAAAVRLFKERGYDGTTMDDVARSLGIRRSSLYHHVAGREQLLETAVGNALDQITAVFDEPGAVTGAAVDRLEHVLRRTVEVMVGHLDEVTVLLRVRGNTAVERTALERRREVDRRLETIVRAATSEGSIAVAGDPRLTTRLLFGMTNSITEWYVPGGALTARELAASIVRLAMTGLVGVAARDAPTGHA